MEAELANTIHMFHKIAEGAQCEHYSWTGSREHIKKMPKFNTDIHELNLCLLWN